MQSLDQFTYDTSTEPSIFSGSLGDSIKATFATVGKRFTFGGDTGKDQRIYYFNTKELIDNKFGTPNPIPFRVVDSKIGLDIDVSVRCSGVYSYRISNPLLFYTNVCGNVENEYTRDELDRQLKTEFISALQPAFGKLSELELRPNQIVTHNTDLENAMNETLSAKWGELRGLKVVSIALGSVTLPDEDAEMIKQAQRTAMLQNPTMAAATMVGAQADAMKAAAANESGAMNGFIGMGMAMNAGGGMNAQNLFAMGAQQEEARRQEEMKRQEDARQQEEMRRQEAMQQQQMAAAPVQQQGADSWTCSCGQIVTGKFCPECGAKKPEPSIGPAKVLAGHAVVVMSQQASSVRNVVRRDRRSRQAGFAAVVHSIKASSVLNAVQRSRQKNHCTAVINVAGSRKIRNIRRNSVRNAVIRSMMQIFSHNR